jgi:hypothetical protein
LTQTGALVVGVGPVRDIPEGRRTVFASVILRCPWAAGAASFLFFFRGAEIEQKYFSQPNKM